MKEPIKNILALLLSTSTIIGSVVNDSSGQVSTLKDSTLTVSQRRNSSTVVFQKKSNTVIPQKNPSDVVQKDTTNKFDQTGLWGYYNLTSQQIGARYNTKPIAHGKVYPFATISHETPNNNSVGGLFLGIGAETKDTPKTFLNKQFAFNAFAALRHSIGAAVGQTDLKAGVGAKMPINSSGSIQGFAQLALGLTQINLGLSQYGIKDPTNVYASGSFGVQANLQELFSKEKHPKNLLNNPPKF